MLRSVLFILTILAIGVASFFTYRYFTKKTIAILLYDGFNMLEAVGAYQTFPGLMMKNYRMKFVAKEKGSIHSSHIQSLQADFNLSELTNADILYIPGGDHMETILEDEDILNWIQTINKSTQYTMSVGGGTLLLAKAGLLEGKKTASHWYHQRQLEALGATYTDHNFVKDGKYFTGAGASASIDMVLEIINEIAGKGDSKAMQLFIEYDAAPPVFSNTFQKADSAVCAIAQQLVAGSIPNSVNSKKTIAMMLYPGFTMLDITGPYQVFKELEPLGYQMKFVVKEKGTVPSDMILSYQSDHNLAAVKNAEILFIPGGSRTAKAMADIEIVNWIKNINNTTKYSTSVCTGSLLLAKAGLIKNKNASCHWYAGRFLKDYEVNFSKERYTIDGKYITGAGVSSGIDLALFIVKEAIGKKYAEAVQLKLGYFPGPPFDAGSPEKSEEKTVERLSKMFSDATKRYALAKQANN